MACEHALHWKVPDGVCQICRAEAAERELANANGQMAEWGRWVIQAQAERDAARAEAEAAERERDEVLHVLHHHTLCNAHKKAIAERDEARRANLTLNRLLGEAREALEAVEPVLRFPQGPRGEDGG